jgi:hypothetical protein
MSGTGARLAAAVLALVVGAPLAAPAACLTRDDARTADDHGCCASGLVAVRASCCIGAVPVGQTPAPATRTHLPAPAVGPSPGPVATDAAPDVRVAPAAAPGRAAWHDPPLRPALRV